METKETSSNPNRTVSLTNEFRAAKDGLREESSMVFDLLKKDDLSGIDIKRIKRVPESLVEELNAERLRVDHWRDKESTPDAVSLAIYDFLYSDQTGLPVDFYDVEEVERLSGEMYRHGFRTYHRIPSPIYSSSSAA
ncbi:MAG: hypothetical protein O7C75_14680 [Verrucomicrobia bacterium]|nr:hypothetical protein [Verrucomicrobiota bacterium]